MRRLEVETATGRQTIPVEDRARHRPLADLLRRQDLPLNTRCGQRSLCDGCVIDLVRGALCHIPSGKIHRSGTTPLTVRGCEHRIGDEEGTVVIRIGPRSLLAHRPSVLTDFKINVPWAHEPLPPAADITESPPRIGAAIDLGTTTVAVLLVDLEDDRVIGRAAGFNKQMRHADNVLTRIGLCGTDRSMIGELQRSAVGDTIAPLLSKAMNIADVTGSPLRCLTIAGNSTMLHLVAGVDPSPMGVAPFTAPFLNHRILSCRSIHLAPATVGPGNSESDPPVHLLPGASAYVGADLCSGIFSSGLVYDEGPSLLVDVGTNGEIIAKQGDCLLGCAAAAGPAFEGAGLACGIRAGDGAISHVWFERDPFAVRYETIGGGRPVGACGTAYIDLMARARDIELLSETGRFNHDALEGAADHFVEHDEYGRGLRIAHGQGKRDILVTEPDIASLLQAKAAIGAGILTLLDRLGLQPRDVKTVYLAGGFGMYMDITSAIGCGLLPGFEPHQVQLVGNTSLAGAYLALVDAGVIDQLEDISRQLEVIELNLDPQFESRFIDMLSL